MRVRTLAAIAAIATTGIVGAVGSGTPAGAGPLPACGGTSADTPDGRISVDDGPIHGIGVFGLTPRNAGIVDDGVSATFKLRWKNLTTSTETVRIKLRARTGQGEVSVRYFLDGVDITRLIKDEGKVVVHDVAPQKSAFLVLVLRNLPGGASNPRGTADLDGRYRGAALATQCDALSARINDD